MVPKRKRTKTAIGALIIVLLDWPHNAEDERRRLLICPDEPPFAQSNGSAENRSLHRYFPSYLSAAVTCPKET